jgi:hypothetical protein
MLGHTFELVGAKLTVSLKPLLHDVVAVPSVTFINKWQLLN